MIALRSFIGKPWAIPSDPPNSFDCWSLAQAVRNVYGLDTPSYVDLKSRRASDRHMIEGIAGTEWERLLLPVLGCVVRIGQTHIGVHVGPGQVIHAQHGMGVRVDRSDFLRLSETLSFWELKHASN
jgi:cell wall-associated NlpC family hydrolase